MMILTIIFVFLFFRVFWWMMKTGLRFFAGILGFAALAVAIALAVIVAGIFFYLLPLILIVGLIVMIAKA